VRWPDDVITDFSRGEGELLIDKSDYGSGTVPAGQRYADAMRLRWKRRT
jgi:hypothetical protein